MKGKPYIAIAIILLLWGPGLLEARIPLRMQQVPDSLSRNLADSSAFEVIDSIIDPFLDSTASASADSTFVPIRRKPPVDSAGTIVRDSLGLYYFIDEEGFIQLDSTGRETIDSLKSFTETQIQKFRFLAKYKLPDSDTVRIPLRDSTGSLARDEYGYFYKLDSVGLIKLDSVGYYVIDSLLSFTPKELKRFARWDKRAAKHIADSIYRATPRMLESYAVDDSLRTKRMISWTHDTYFDKVKAQPIDTGINNSFHDYAFLSKDVGATYLGVAGSPTQLHNYFKRDKKERFEFWDVHMSEAYSRDNLPFYNSKSPYTLLSYSGTLFANKQKEESNLDLRHNQNLSPELNISVFYKRRGGRGMLENEDNDQRTFSFSTNYLGKRYVMHAGYIFNRVTRSENGGSSNDFFIQDTIVEIRAVPITLKDASTQLKDNTFFITQKYGVPLRLSKKDSSAAGEGTAFFLGHSGELSFLSRRYNDFIDKSDTTARKFYNNQFFLNPAISNDSVKLFKLDNRFFISLQPWSKDAIVSQLEGGVGYEMLHNYAFRPEYYLKGNQLYKENNFYFYAGASGSFRRYFSWDAMARYDFLGDYQNDLMINGNIRFSAYTRRLRSGIHLKGRFYSNLYSADFFTREYYSNHYIWKNNYDKTNDTRIEASLSIPDWKFEVGFSYGLLTNGIYYDTLSTPIQSSEAVSIMTATLRKDFRIWYFHFDNRVLFQLSSNEEVVPLPKVSANLRYYLQFPLVKNVCDVQLGVDATFYTQYYSQAYNPALGRFVNQNEKKIGNNPYLDAFINFKWKRATIFVKYVNAAQNWPEQNYYSTLHYIRPQKAIKLGMSWPFHIKPDGNKGSSSGSSSSANDLNSNNTNSGVSGRSRQHNR